MATTPRTALHCLVRRDDWRIARVDDGPLPPALAPGQVLLRVDRFALTANNVTYALAGDLLGYWQFFPAAPPWGRVPAMGFADVLESAHDAIAPGERLFGFVPMSTHCLLEACTAEPDRILDGAAHRQQSAPVYRQYLRTARDPLYDPAREGLLALLRGLFLTAFLLDDFLHAADVFGARRILVTSASSKTAIALAFRLRQRGCHEVVGLTAPARQRFVTGLGCYDLVVPYPAVTSLDPAIPSVLVDLTGDAAVVGALHAHCGAALRYSCAVGATHWDGARPGPDLPGPTPTLFFAPGQLEQRLAEWGAAGFERRLVDAWARFADFATTWLTVVHGHGPAAVTAAWREVVEGRADPARGHVLSLWPAGT